LKAAIDGGAHLHVAFPHWSRNGSVQSSLRIWIALSSIMFFTVLLTVHLLSTSRAGFSEEDQCPATTTCARGKELRICQRNICCLTGIRTLRLLYQQQRV